MLPATAIWSDATNENQKRKHGKSNKFTWTKQKAAINKSANLAIFLTGYWLENDLNESKLETEMIR